jgi:RNA polymerase sigma-70 factor (ECF subfamily)
VSPPAKDLDEHRRRAEAGASPADDGDEQPLRDLMMRYQAGEIEAFDALYVHIAPRLRAWFARQRLDLGADRDDLVQETFLQLHRARHTYSPRRPAAPWIFAIARHVYLMDRRRRWRKQGRETDDAPLARTPLESPARAAEARDALARGLRGTNPKRRAALVLHHFWGLTFGEIGRLLGVRSNTAKLRSSRGARDVRERLGEQEDDR